MKIAYIYDAVYPWIKGGAEKRIYEIGKRLADKGHEVHWYGIGWWFDGNNSRTIDHDGIILHGVCEPMQLYVDGRRSIKEAIYFAEKLLPKLVKERFDVIDCQEFPYFPCFTAKVYSLFRRSRLVITWLEVWDSYWKDYLGYVKGLAGQIVEKIVSKLPDSIITISKMVMNDLISLLNVKIDQTKIAIVPDGIDFSKIHNVRPLEDVEYDVIYVGRLIGHKNVDVLINAIRILKNEIPDIRCCIIGDGPERKNLQMLSHNFGLDGNIEFVGFLERDVDVYSYMKSSKVFVLPSTREGAGLVTLEANACGLPAITVRHKNNAAIEVIEDGKNGFVCELDPISLAESIKIALENANSMRKGCIEFARRYDWCEISKLTEKFYNKLI